MEAAWSLLVPWVTSEIAPSRDREVREDPTRTAGSKGEPRRWRSSRRLRVQRRLRVRDRDVEGEVPSRGNLVGWRDRCRVLGSS